MSGLEYIKVLAKIFVVGLVIIVFAKNMFSPKVLSDTNLKTAYGSVKQLCLEHETCMVFYVAPWCPACKSASSKILGIRQYIQNNPDISSRVGVEVIVGLSAQRELVSFAAQFGSNVFLDEDGIIYRDIGVRGVPAVFSMKQSGEILGTGHLYNGVSSEELTSMLIKKLNLNTY